MLQRNISNNCSHVWPSDRVRLGISWPFLKFYEKWKYLDKSAVFGQCYPTRDSAGFQPWGPPHSMWILFFPKFKQHWSPLTKDWAAFLGNLLCWMAEKARLKNTNMQKLFVCLFFLLFFFFANKSFSNWCFSLKKILARETIVCLWSFLRWKESGPHPASDAVFEQKQLNFYQRPFFAGQKFETRQQQVSEIRKNSPEPLERSVSNMYAASNSERCKFGLWLFIHFSYHVFFAHALFYFMYIFVIWLGKEMWAPSSKQTKAIFFGLRYLFTGTQERKLSAEAALP